MVTGPIHGYTHTSTANATQTAINHSQGASNQTRRAQDLNHSFIKQFPQANSSANNGLSPVFVEQNHQTTNLTNNVAPGQIDGAAHHQPVDFPASQGRDFFGPLQTQSEFDLPRVWEDFGSNQPAEDMDIDSILDPAIWNDLTLTNQVEGQEQAEVQGQQPIVQEQQSSNEQQHQAQAMQQQSVQGETSQQVFNEVFGDDDEDWVRRFQPVVDFNSKN